MGNHLKILTSHGTLPHFYVRKIMEGIFQIVYLLLQAISNLTGLSYNEVNIVSYYIILPFIYIALADKIIKKNIIKVIYVFGMLVGLFLIKDFSEFSDW
jgi:hypothetical protein